MSLSVSVRPENKTLCHYLEDHSNCTFLTCNVSQLVLRNLKRFYLLESANETHGVYTCYKNFHFLSGDMVHICRANGSWYGEEPLCQVDYYMDRFRLSVFIVSVVIILCACLLVPDFLQFYYKKRIYRERLAVIETMKEGMEGIRYSRASPFTFTKSFHKVQFRKTYFERANSYEEDFLGTGARPHELFSHEFGAHRPMQDGKKPATLLTIITKAFRRQPGDPNYV